jgi:TFIIF-interacting CTD phosphatase-like protein
VAERDAERTAERLTAAKKLSLVLDLDQTLVHATQVCFSSLPFIHSFL